MKFTPTPWRLGSRRFVSSLALAAGAAFTVLGCQSKEMQEGFAPPTSEATDSSTIALSAPTTSAAVIEGLTLSPTSANLAPGGRVTFTPLGWLHGGGPPIVASVTWKATGGTITGGVYTAGTTPETYEVTAFSTEIWNRETAKVTISGSGITPVITRLNQSPTSVTLGTGATQQFSASADLSNGSKLANPTVTWWTSGGKISATGLYTAPNVAGAFTVIGRSDNGLKDTSNVTVTSSTATITRITLSPPSATVNAGATQQFVGSAILSNGSTQANPALTWSATGGTVTSSGVYKAGNLAGSYRVIATSSNGKSDTSAVSIVGATPPPISPPPLGAVGTYFNSSEAGCGSDPNVLFCDDFERGKWFVTTADKGNPSNAGWNGTPYGSADPEGKNFGRCGGQGVAGTSCAATNGGHTGIGQARGMADHDLASATSEVYWRYYVKPLLGYSFGQEKALSFNRGEAGVGGIYFGSMFFGQGSGQSSIVPHFYAINQGINLTQNQGGLSMTGGNWYFIELHLKLNGNGSDVVEMWMDNCGSNGLGCTGSPTLRARYTNASLRPGGDNNSTIKSVWLENWANPAAAGEMLYDQIKVSRVGPIGFKR